MALAQNNFENLPVRQAVLKQIIPALVSQMIVLIYHLADTYFVGLLNDPKQVAAVTIVGPIFLLLTAISTRSRQKRARHCASNIQRNLLGWNRHRHFGLSGFSSLRDTYT